MNEEYLRRNMDLVVSTGAFYPSLSFMAGLGMLTVLYVGGRLVIQDAITVGDFVAFGFYLTMMIWPMIALGWVINLFQRAAASLTRIVDVFDTPAAIRGPTAPVELSEVRGEIEFRNVSFRYPGTERRVIEDASFTLPAGSTVALVGPTGAGKSTVIALVARLYDPTDGVVLLDGVPLPDLSARHGTERHRRWSPRTPSSSARPSPRTLRWASRPGTTRKPTHGAGAGRGLHRAAGRGHCRVPARLRDPTGGARGEPLRWAAAADHAGPRHRA